MWSESLSSVRQPFISWVTGSGEFPIHETVNSMAVLGVSSLSLFALYCVYRVTRFTARLTGTGFGLATSLFRTPMSRIFSGIMLAAIGLFGPGSVVNQPDKNIDVIVEQALRCALSDSRNIVLTQQDKLDITASVLAGLKDNPRIVAEPIYTARDYGLGNLTTIFGLCVAASGVMAGAKKYKEQ